MFEYPGPPVPSAHVLEARDPLLAYAEEVFGPSTPASETSDDDPLLRIWRRHQARMVEHTRRRELLLGSGRSGMTATLSREVEGHENNTRTFYLRQVYGVPGLRTPAEQSRWECALRVEMLAAKVHAPPPHVAEAGSVYR